ncbi:hypothetical protein [Nocardia nova]|uniref:hypothetical protein n=1 Tax=Nocardia nova TaxID=37330 RepID=UPI0033F5E295
MLAAALLISTLPACGSGDDGSSSPPVAPQNANADPCPATTPGAPARYQVTRDRERNQNAQVAYDVTVPQLAGGEDAVRERFNTAMRASLTDRVTEAKGMIVDGGLPYRCAESSHVTRIGDHVVAGILVTSYNFGGPHPTNQLGTIVVDTGTAQPVRLASALNDSDSAWTALAVMAPNLVPSGEPPLSEPARSEVSFVNWVPSPEGLTVYFPVAHVAGDFHPVLYPWDRIRDLFKSEALAILSS